MDRETLTLRAKVHNLVIDFRDDPASRTFGGYAGALDRLVDGICGLLPPPAPGVAPPDEWVAMRLDAAKSVIANVRDDAGLQAGRIARRKALEYINAFLAHRHEATPEA